MMSSSVQSDSGAQALLKLLVKLGLLDAKALSKSQKFTTSGPIATLSAQGLLNEDQAIKAVSIALSIPVWRVEKNDREKYILLLETPPLNTVAPSRWKQLRAIPVQLNERKLTLMMANPLDHETRSSIEFDLGCQIISTIGKESDIISLLDEKESKITSDDLNTLVEEQIDEPADTSGELQDRTETNLFSGDIAAPTVVRLVDKILSDSIQRGASDIHITPEKDKLSVRIRIDGMLRDLFIIPQNLRNPVLSRLKLLSGLDISERRKPQDGRLRSKSGSVTKDMRVSTVPTMFGENIVIRILSSDMNRSTFDSLGMRPEFEAQFKRALKGSSRVVLVTGPTGSGKTSTLYAGLLHLRDGKTNIITVEDPIEYKIEGITQIQMNTKIGVSFAEGLRSILRQDPDVIMVGEIRDLETAHISMQAAQTGHLVLSTVHTNTASAAVTRLKDLGVPSYILASSVACVLSQRLVRTLCKFCVAPALEDEWKRTSPVGVGEDSLKRSVGCKECGDTGYHGRTGIFSILEVSESVREAIRNDMSEAEIEERARLNGFKTLWESAIDLLREGVTSLSEVERVLGPIEVAMDSLPSTIHSVTSKPTEHSAASGLAKRRILLVEDDENTRTVLAMVLRDQMFDVLEAENGFDALEKVYQYQPELIVSDLMMPRMSGLDMVQRLRADTRTRAIPILMLTAASTEQNELQLISQGADDFVGKTVDTKIMIARIHRLLDRAQN